MENSHLGDVSAATSAATDENSAFDTSGRRKSAAFALFILGELLDEPHHGYLLRDILARMLGPFRPISWGAIYPLIRQLEADGCIALDPAPLTESNVTPSSRQRRNYRITPTGRERFLALMLAPEPYTADYRELFTVKLLYLDSLTTDQQRAILTRYQDFLVRQRDHMQHVFTPRSTTAHLPPAAREPIFRTMRFRLASVLAELQWVDDALARLKGAPIPMP